MKLYSCLQITKRKINDSGPDFSKHSMNLNYSELPHELNNFNLLAADSSVSIVTVYCLDDRGSNPSRRKISFS
jgi:hypothetical protein